MVDCINYLKNGRFVEFECKVLVVIACAFANSLFQLYLDSIKTTCTFLFNFLNESFLLANFPFYKIIKSNLSMLFFLFVLF